MGHANGGPLPHSKSKGWLTTYTLETQKHTGKCVLKPYTLFEYAFYFATNAYDHRHPARCHLVGFGQNYVAVLSSPIIESAGSYSGCTSSTVLFLSVVDTESTTGCGNGCESSVCITCNLVSHTCRTFQHFSSPTFHL